MSDLDYRREVMINNHLRARGITDPRVISAMREVPREEFIAPEYRAYAYDDHPLPIDEGQTISQPYIVAYMTEALSLSDADRVLEVGTGSGYAAAVLSRMVARVFTVERLPALARAAAERLARLGYDNVTVIDGDGTLGWPEFAPYDAIVVTAAAPDVPKPLMEQLAVDGRLILPVGRSTYVQSLLRVRRVGPAQFERDFLTDVRFVPLIGAFGWRE